MKGLILKLLIIFIILFSTVLQFSKTKRIENYIVEEKLNRFKIPNIIYRTHKTKDVCEPMYQACHKKWIELNPDYSLIWYDNKECDNYLEDLIYSKDIFLSSNINRILNCYKKIKPGSFKADIWRLIILYDKGGIYVDSYASPFVSIEKMLNSINSINDISLITVRDCVCNGIDNGIHNGFIMSTPRNSHIKNYILKILENIENNYYGNHCLEVTGPILMYNSLLETLSPFGINKLKVGCNGNIYLYDFEWGPYQNVKDIKGRNIFCKKYSILHQLYVLIMRRGYSKMWKHREIY